MDLKLHYRHLIANHILSFPQTSSQQSAAEDTERHQREHMISCCCKFLPVYGQELTSFTCSQHRYTGCVPAEVGQRLPDNVGFLVGNAPSLKGGKTATPRFSPELMKQGSVYWKDHLTGPEAAEMWREEQWGWSPSALPSPEHWASMTHDSKQVGPIKPQLYCSGLCYWGFFGPPTSPHCHFSNARTWGIFSVGQPPSDWTLHAMTHRVEWLWKVQWLSQVGAGYKRASP